jgi:type I restriction enzyme M protein
MLYGAIVGDIAGSCYEFHNIKTKEGWPIITRGHFFTDDTVMTCAIAQAVMHSKPDFSDLSDLAVKSMQSLGHLYPRAGYGGRFRRWLQSEDPRPYYSYGNGAAMRVSPVAYVAKTYDDVIDLSRAVTAVTHDHPEGIKGAEATAICIWAALHDWTKDEIRDHIKQTYYPLDFTLDEIRPAYRFDETCQGSVPQAIEAFLEADDYMDAIRNAVSIGGDSDTIAAITGSIAGAFYGVPESLRERAAERLTVDLKDIINDFDLYLEGGLNP